MEQANEEDEWEEDNKDKEDSDDNKKRWAERGTLKRMQIARKAALMIATVRKTNQRMPRIVRMALTLKNKTKNL